MPLITISLLTYNRAALLPRAIRSVLDQTYKDFQLIISDDNSTDNTSEIVEPYLADKRLTYVRHEGIGMTANFIKSLQLATGKYFMWLCDDDYIAEDYLEKTLHFLEHNEGYSVAAGTTVFFSSAGFSEKRETLTLEDTDAAKRLYAYFHHVDSNIILYGLMLREQIRDFIYPDTFGADLLWSAQVVFAGKAKILNDTFFYYSKEGISQQTENLVQYYKAIDNKTKNPYLYLRAAAVKLIAGRKGAFKSLSILKSWWIAMRIWTIIRDRFCITPREAKIRSTLRIGTRIKALIR